MTTIRLSYDILLHLYRIYEFEMLDGRIQCIAELLSQGHHVILERKLKDHHTETVITLYHKEDLDIFIEGYFPGWKPSKNYKYI